MGMMELSYDYRKTRIAIGAFDRINVNEVSYSFLFENEAGKTLKMEDGTDVPPSSGPI